MKLAHLILERKGKNIGADMLITYISIGLSFFQKLLVVNLKLA